MKCSVVVIFLLAILSIAITDKNVFESESRNERIVGGGSVIPHEFPHSVLILIGSSVYCAGSIVNEEWILTAAQCVTHSAFYYQISAGEHNRAVYEGNEQHRFVDRIVVHPRYEASGSVDHEADVALMHVTEPFEFNEFVQPAVFSESGSEMTANGTVIGWGDNGSGPPNTLHKVAVPFVSDERCKEVYGEDKIVESMICYGDLNKDACTGDSGAPLMCQDLVCGVVSWGFGCGVQGFPTVYSEMSYFTNWVMSQISPREEDPFPAMTILDCSGKINTTSARISINSPIGEPTRCSWLVYIPLVNIRFVLRNLLQRDSIVHVTEFDTFGAPLESRPIVLPNQNHSVSGPLFIVSLTSSPEFAESFTIEMFGSGVGTYDEWDNAVSLPGQSGSYSYPEHGGLYNIREVSHFLHSPRTLEPNAITFTRMQIENHATCIFDSLSLYAWNGTGYNLMNRYCGQNLPSPAQVPLGDFLFVFTTDDSVNLSGFAFEW